MGEEALNFINEAYVALTDDQNLNLDEQTKTNIYNAIQSLDLINEGFNLDDFMRAVQTLAVWNIQGRTDNDLPGGDSPITDK